MALFTLEIDGLAVMVFPESDLESAQTEIDEGHISEELLGLDYKDRPLWDGESDLIVRPSTEAESAKWEAGFTKAMRAGDAEEGDKEEWAVFIVKVTEAVEDDEEEDEAGAGE